MAKQVGQHPVELVGEVRAVTLNDGDDGGGVCRLRLDDGATISVNFDARHEFSVAMALLHHAYELIRISGLGDFGPDGKLKRVLRVDTHKPEWIRQPSPLPFDTTNLTISQVFIEAGKLIPEEEWAKFPPDFAENMDHYMYGAPKRGEE